MPETATVKPNKIDGEEFRAIIKDLADGRQITRQELADAICYADRLPELKVLTQALVEGWQIAMTRIDYKNQRIGRLERQIGAIRRKIQQSEKEAGHV